VVLFINTEALELSQIKRYSKQTRGLVSKEIVVLRQWGRELDETLDLSTELIM